MRLTSLPASKWRNYSVGAFTLVELLAAMAVLLLMITIFAQAIIGISNAWQSSQGRMNNHTKARSLLGRLQTDVDAMVLRPDLAAFPSAAKREFGFYSLRRGVENGDSAAQVRTLSYVTYAFDPAKSGRLLRKDQKFIYDKSDVLEFGPAPTPVVGSGSPNPAATPDRGTAPTGAAETDVALADGVLAFEWAFIRQDGTFSPTIDYVGTDGKARTAKGVVVGMAVIDEKAADSLTKAMPGDPLGDLQGRLDLPDASQGQSDWDPKASWEDVLGLRVGSSGSAIGNLPSRFLSGIRVFQRIYLFPNKN